MTLVMSNIRKSFGKKGSEKTILKDVSLTLQAGQTLALTGESGAGKSTLLHLAGALDDCDAGQITVAGHRVDQMNETQRAELRCKIVSVIFQQFNLVPSLNTRQNIALQARLANRFDDLWCGDLCNALGLSEYMDYYPEQLSGGQQQRVAIARALAVRPRLLLADEPTGNLDEDTSDKVMTALLELVSQQGTSLLLVTHSSTIAARLDRHLHLRQGQIS